MKITILGEFGPSQLGASFARAFRVLGHEVVEISQLHGVGRVRFRLGSGRLGEGIGRLVRRSVEDETLQAIPECDLVLILKGTLLSPRFFGRLRQRRTRARQVVFNPDNPFNLNGSSSFQHIIDSIPMPDLQLIWSRDLVMALRKAGARQAEFLPFGVDEAEFHPLVIPKSEELRLGAGVAFVGNWDREREEWLSSVAEFGLGIWGNDWWRARARRLRAAWRGAAVYGPELLKVIAATEIHLNILRHQNWGGHNMRLFELPACRRLQLVQSRADLEGLFESGKEILTFNDPEDLRNQVRLLRHDSAMVARVANAGHARAGVHTYMQRARDIINWTTAARNGQTTRVATGDPGGDVRMTAEK